MAEKEYKIVYRADPSNAIAGTNALGRVLVVLDALVDRIGRKFTALNDVFTSTTRRAGATAKKGDDLARSFRGVESSARDATARVEELGGSFGGATGHANGLGLGLGRIGLAAASLSLVRDAARGLADALKDAREFAHQTAEENIKLRDTLREMVALGGKDQTTAGATQEVMDLMLKTGARFEEAKEFNVQFEGAVFAARQKGNFKLDKEQTEELKTQALRFGTAVGIDPKTLGVALGAMGISQEIKSVDDALGQIGAAFQFANEGVGNLTPIFRVMQQLRGFGVHPDGRGGMAKSEAELMAIISVDTGDEGNPLAAARSINQAHRELNKPKVAKALGLGPTAQLTERLGAVKLVIEKARAEGRNELEAMGDIGLRNGDANRKIVQLTDNLDLIEQRRARVGVEGDPRRVRAINDRFIAENPARLSEAAEFASRQKRGEETRDLEVARKFAEAGARNRNAIDRPFTNVAEKLIDNIVPFAGGVGDEPARLKVLDTIISQNILKTVPGAQEKFPDLAPGLSLDVRPGAQVARGKRLADILKSLPPEQRTAVMASLQDFAGGRVAAPDGGAQPARGGADLQRIAQEQLREQQRTNALLRQKANQLPPPGGGGAAPGRK